MTCSSTDNIGTGTPGYEFASENLAGATYLAGALAMANAVLTALIRFLPRSEPVA